MWGKTKEESEKGEENIRTQLITQLNYFGGLGTEHATLFVAFIFGLFSVLAILAQKEFQTSSKFWVLTLAYYVFMIGGSYEFFKFSYYNKVTNLINDELNRHVTNRQYCYDVFNWTTMYDKEESIYTILTRTLHRLHSKNLTLEIIFSVYISVVFFSWLTISPFFSIHMFLILLGLLFIFLSYLVYTKYWSYKLIWARLKKKEARKIEFVLENGTGIDIKITDIFVNGLSVMDFPNSFGAKVWSYMSETGLDITLTFSPDLRHGIYIIEIKPRNYIPPIGVVI